MARVKGTARGATTAAQGRSVRTATLQRRTTEATAREARMMANVWGLSVCGSAQHKQQQRSFYAFDIKCTVCSGTLKLHAVVTARFSEHVARCTWRPSVRDLMVSKL